MSGSMRLWTIESADGKPLVQDVGDDEFRAEMERLLGWHGHVNVTFRDVPAESGLAESQGAPADGGEQQRNDWGPPPWEESSCDGEHSRGTTGETDAAGAASPAVQEMARGIAAAAMTTGAAMAQGMTAGAETPQADGSDRPSSGAGNARAAEAVLNGLARSPWLVSIEDAASLCRSLPEGLVQLAITSPPYYQTRQYGGGELEIGGESSVNDYLARLVEVFNAVGRTLTPDGTLVVNIGDTYAKTGASGRPPRSLLLIPARLALALQDSGWTLLAMIPWLKFNAQPEPAGHRPTAAVEYLLMLSMGDSYWNADAVRRPVAASTIERDKYSRILQREEQTAVRHNHETPSSPKGRYLRYADFVVDAASGVAEELAAHAENLRAEADAAIGVMTACANYLTGLASGEQGLYAGVDGEPLLLTANVARRRAAGVSHPATFPSQLVEPFVAACTRPGDVVLDPFMGVGTAGVVALRAGRRFLGCDIVPDYVRAAAEACDRAAGPQREEGIPEEGIPEEADSEEDSHGREDREDQESSAKPVKPAKPAKRKRSRRTTSGGGTAAESAGEPAAPTAGGEDAAA